MNSGPAKILPTWSGKSKFKYHGSVSKGTEIEYGTARSKQSVSDVQYRDLLRHFSKKEVPIGASRDNPPPSSLGAWLKAHVTQTAIASYVGPILGREGFAKKAGAHGELITFS